MSNVDDGDVNAYRNVFATLLFIEGIIHCLARYLICNKNDRHKVRSCMGV